MDDVPERKRTRQGVGIGVVVGDNEDVFLVGEGIEKLFDFFRGRHFFSLIHRSASPFSSLLSSSRRLPTF